MPITTICNAKIGLSHVYVYLSCLSCPSHILWRRAALQRLRLHSFLSVFEHQQLVRSEVNTRHMSHMSFRDLSIRSFHTISQCTGSAACGTSVSTSGPQGDLAKTLGCHFLSQLRSGWMDVNILNMINHRKTIQTEFPTMSLAYVVYIVRHCLPVC